MNTILPYIFLAIMIAAFGTAIVLAIVTFVKGLIRHFINYGK